MTDPDAVNKLSFPLPMEAPHIIRQVVSEMFEIVGEDGRTPDHGYTCTISSPGEYLAQVSYIHVCGKCQIKNFIVDQKLVKLS